MVFAFTGRTGSAFEQAAEGRGGVRSAAQSQRMVQAELTKVGLAHPAAACDFAATALPDLARSGSKLSRLRCCWVLASVAWGRAAGVEAVGCVVGVPRVGSPAVTHTLTLSRQAIMGTVRAWKTQVAREGGPRLCTSKQRQPAVGVQHQRGRSLEPQDHRPRRGRENNARPRPLQARADTQSIWNLDKARRGCWMCGRNCATVQL
jgi:hypothetical protein